MLRRLRRASIIASPVVALGAWSIVVLEDRKNSPPDVRFPIGSQDDMLAEKLKTGDVLLFSRRWTNMLPLGAALNIMKKAAFETRFDHAGVVIADRFGTPHVAEVTYSGIKFRRFDERVLRSRCDEILLVPVQYECSEKARAKVERHVRGMAYREPITNTLWLEFLGLVKYKTTKLDEWNKPPKYASEPNIIGNIVPASPAVQLVMSCLDIAEAVDGEKIAEWKFPLALTPRDLENREVPLKGGVKFGEPHTVRVKK